MGLGREPGRRALADRGVPAPVRPAPAHVVSVIDAPSRRESVRSRCACSALGLSPSCGTASSSTRGRGRASRASWPRSAASSSSPDRAMGPAGIQVGTTRSRSVPRQPARSSTHWASAHPWTGWATRGEAMSGSLRAPMAGTMSTIVALGTPIQPLTRTERIRTNSLLWAYRLLGPAGFIRKGVVDTLCRPGPAHRIQRPSPSSRMPDSRRPGRAAQRRRVDLAAAANLTKRLPEVSVPTLFVTGTDHKGWSPSRPRLQAGCWRMVRRPSSKARPTSFRSKPRPRPSAWSASSGSATDRTSRPPESSVGVQTAALRRTSNTAHVSCYS